MTIQTFVLFQNQTVNATSAVFVVNYPNERGVIKASGIFGGATIMIQNIAPSTSPAVWINVPDLTGNTVGFTTNGQAIMGGIVQGESVRAVLTGATGTTNITVTLEPL
jgi:hypothetical protein